MTMFDVEHRTLKKMRIKYTLKTALNALWAHKSRSGLTILGIVIGVSSIILIMSIGKGAEELILNQIRGMGSAIISIDPGRAPKGPSDFAELFTDSLTAKDLAALENPANVQGIIGVSPVMSLNATVSYGSEGKRVLIIGGSKLIAQIYDLTLDKGNFFTEEDIRQKAAVAVLGAEIKKELFGDSDAIGKKIKIKNKSFRVVAVIR